MGRLSRVCLVCLAGEREQVMTESTKAKLKAQLEQDFGTEGNPKADKLFELAWKYKHSYGLEGVVDYYTDMLPLILGPDAINGVNR
jgi:hypothetical protein